MLSMYAIPAISWLIPMFILHCKTINSNIYILVCTYWKNLKALTVAPELANSLLRSSSITEGLNVDEVYLKQLVSKGILFWLWK